MGLWGSFDAIGMIYYETSHLLWAAVSTDFLLDCLLLLDLKENISTYFES